VSQTDRPHQVLVFHGGTGQGEKAERRSVLASKLLIVKGKHATIKPTSGRVGAKRKIFSRCVVGGGTTELWERVLRRAAGGLRQAEKYVKGKKVETTRNYKEGKGQGLISGK